MDDLEFVRRCVKGDKQSWDEFVDKYSRLIYSYIYGILNTQTSPVSNQDHANDLFQEILFSLVKDNFKKLKSFQAKNGCSLASWLRQVTVNHTIDFIRKARPLVSLDARQDSGLVLKDILSSAEPSIVDTIAEKEKMADLKDCIESLNSDDKYFLALYINKGMAMEKLKNHLKLSRSGVDMRKSRIIERLKECFKSKGFAVIENT